MVPHYLDLSAIKQGLNSKSNEDLLNILTHNQDDYRVEVIHVIKVTLTDRGVSKDDIANADAYYIANVNKRTIEIKQQQRDTKIPKYLLWFMWLAGAAMLKFLIGLLLNASI